MGLVNSGYVPGRWYNWDPIHVDTTYVWKPTLATSYNKNNVTVASRVCITCPTARQLMGYLNAGAYWDNGHNGAGMQTHSFKSGGVFHTGLWLKKGASPVATDAEILLETNKLLAWPSDGDQSIRSSGQYFFLPAASCNDENLGYYQIRTKYNFVRNYGEAGIYWTRNGPSTDYTAAYTLTFTATQAIVRLYSRSFYGFSLWKTE